MKNIKILIFEGNVHIHSLGLAIMNAYKGYRPPISKIISVSCLVKNSGEILNAEGTGIEMEANRVSLSENGKEYIYENLTQVVIVEDYNIILVESQEIIFNKKAFSQFRKDSPDT